MAKRPKVKKEQAELNSEPDNSKKIAASTRYPLWAKLIIACVLTGWLAFLGCFSYLLFACVQLLKVATNPAVVAQESRKIARFPDKLPEGFKYTFTGLPFSYSLMTVTYVPDATVFVIGTKPTSDLGTDDARKLVQNPKDFGLPNVYGEMNVESQGNLDVAGRKMEYVSGYSSNGKERAIGCFIGCAMLENKNALIVYAVTPVNPQDDSSANQKASFDLDAAKKLFAAIKGF